MVLERVVLRVHLERTVHIHFLWRYPRFLITRCVETASWNRLRGEHHTLIILIVRIKRLSLRQHHCIALGCCLSVSTASCSQVVARSLLRLLLSFPDFFDLILTSGPQFLQFQFQISDFLVLLTEHLVLFLQLGLHNLIIRGHILCFLLLNRNYALEFAQLQT